MLITFQKNVFHIVSKSREFRESGALFTPPPDWYWTGEAWHATADNAKTFPDLKDAIAEMATIALPD